MNWKKITVISGIVITGLVITAVIVISNYDYNTFKPAISKLAKEATGRDLVLDGDLKLEIGMSPSLVIEDVSFQNAEWGSQPAMINIKRFEMAVALMPLFSRSVQVKRFIMEEPDILIETDAEGRSNLAFNSQAGQKSPETVEANSGGDESGEALDMPPISLTFKELRINNGRLRYKDDRHKQLITLALNTLAADAKGDGEPVNLSLKGGYNNTPFEIEGALGWIDGLLVSDTPWPVDLKIKVADAVISAKGEIQDPVKPQGISLGVSVDGASTAKLAAIADLKNIPDIGPFKISFNVSDPEPKKYRVSDLDVTFRESDIKGALLLDLNEKRPALTADFSSKFLDLTPLLLGDAPGNKRGETGKKKKNIPKRAGKVFPNDPLPFDALKKVDAEIKVRMARVLTPKLTLDNLAVDGNLKNGRLVVNPLRSTIGGSALSGKMEIDAWKARISNRIDIKRINLGEMIRKQGKKVLVRGKLDVHLDIKGYGNSVAAIMGSLNGNSVISMSNGEIDNRYMDLLTLEFTRGILEQIFGLLGEKRDSTIVNCFVLNTDFKNGIAHVAPMILDTPDMMLAGSGQINLKNERLDLSIQPKQKKGIAGVNLSLGELSKLFKLTGTLANPSLGIDPVQTTIAIGRFLGGNAAFGAAGAAVAILGSENVKDNPCVLAFEALESGQTAEGSENKAVKPVKKTVKKVQDAVESVGKGLLDIFGGSKKK